MPHQDGWSVLRALKNDPELCTIPGDLATILQTASWVFARRGRISDEADRYRQAGPDDRDIRGGQARTFWSSTTTRPPREFSGRILVKRKWTVHEAGDGSADVNDEADSAASRLLDLLMPEMDGFQTLSEMQRIPELQNIRCGGHVEDPLRKRVKWLRDRAVRCREQRRKQPLPSWSRTRTSDRNGRFVGKALADG